MFGNGNKYLSNLLLYLEFAFWNTESNEIEASWIDEGRHMMTYFCICYDTYLI